MSKPRFVPSSGGEVLYIVPATRRAQACFECRFKKGKMCKLYLTDCHFVRVSLQPTREMCVGFEPKPVPVPWYRRLWCALKGVDIHEL